MKNYGIQFGAVVHDKPEFDTMVQKLFMSLLQRAQFMRKPSTLRRLNKALRPNQTQRRRAFSVHEESGLDPETDRPSVLPEGENKKSQEDKRKFLINMFNEGDRTWPTILKNMKETYVTIRSDINNKKLLMQDLIARWPYFGAVSLF